MTMEPAAFVELTHFEAMTVFALLTSLVFTFLTKYGWRERLKYFLWSFGMFLLVGVGLGWVMYPLAR